MEQDKNLRNFIKTTIREFLNEELRKKTIIGKGKDHVVYDYEGDPSKVIKVAWGSDGNKYDPDAELKLVNLDPSHIATFKKYPEFFPKVHKFTDKYAIIDKLNTDKIKNEQSELYKQFSQLGISDFKYMNENYAIADIYTQLAIRRGLFNKVLQKLIGNGQYFESPILQKYMDFFQRILNSQLGKNKRLDVSAVNIGHDEKGYLKLLDF